MRLSSSFAAGLAALGGSIEHAEEQTHSLESLGERWAAATTWPHGLHIGGIQGRLWLVTYAGVQAKKQGKEVYGWYGPAQAEYGRQ